jgi:4-hydroxybenzoate polyprenyltransferase
MGLARHGDRRRDALVAFGSQIHPVFMLPAVAASLVGGFLAVAFDVLPAGIHATAIFAALYTAHVKDGLVDFHARSEDDDHPLTVWGCRVALLGAGVAFWGCVGLLVIVADVVAVLLTVPCWLIAYFHAPQLDTNPVTATLGYPTGIALSILGGNAVQAGGPSTLALGIAAVFFVVLAGIKVIDDATDYEYDRSIGKDTVAVVLGRRRARTLGFGLMTAAMVGVVALAVVLPAMPPSAVLATVAFGGVALLARHADAELATMLLIRGSYLFLAVLLAALLVRPFG